MGKKKYNKSRRDLFCYGCAWSDDDGGFPGEPGCTFRAGFSPCHMCLRNPQVNELVDIGEPLVYTEFPDGSKPVALPMDLYCPQDMIDQHQQWVEEAVERETQRDVRDQIDKLKREYGVD